MFTAPLQRPDLRGADRAGFTKDEADALAAPLSSFTPRGAYWAATRAAMRLGGMLSEGIRLGHETGFDSGSTLDYVYRNHPTGTTALGRMIDANYLHSIGWRGIRQRKLHIEELLRRAMAEARTAGLPIRILDIAAGHGRYVLEAIDTSAARPDSILLRDYSALNVEHGSALIRAKGLGSIASFVEGDAFDRSSLAAVAPRPTIGIVSGLYELFPANTQVRASLAVMAHAVPPAGF